MFYFDTSFIIPLLLPEETSDRIEHFFHQLPVGEELVVSQWTRVEFASVLSRLVRMGELKKDIALLCNERFGTLLTENFQVVLPGIADFDLCWKFLAQFNNNLRAGDALHLAIAWDGSPACDELQGYLWDLIGMVHAFYCSYLSIL